MVVSAAETVPDAGRVPDVPVLRALGNRRSIRYFDPDRDVERWKIEAMLQAARFASCQGNINATEAIVVRRETCEAWDELAECVSGFNVQIMEQCSHLLLWITNLNAWYGRAIDGLSSVALAAGMAKFHGWNYEFTMTQTIPRLMSFPTERTEILLRFESGQAAANATRPAWAWGSETSWSPSAASPAGWRRSFGLPPHLRFTWGHAVGYPLERADAGGQRPRLRFERLYHDGAYGRPYGSDPATVALLREKGLIQEQSPLPGRFEEMDRLAARFGREPGVVSWPEREIRRLMADDDWDFGPGIRARAEEVIAAGDLPEYPQEMRETFRRLMDEHGIATERYLS